MNEKGTLTLLFALNCILPRPVFHYGGTELVKYLRGSICHDSDYSPCFP